MTSPSWWKNLHSYDYWYKLERPKTQEEQAAQEKHLEEVYRKYTDRIEAQFILRNELFLVTPDSVPDTVFMLLIEQYANEKPSNWQEELNKVLIAALKSKIPYTYLSILATKLILDMESENAELQQHCRPSLNELLQQQAKGENSPSCCFGGSFLPEWYLCTLPNFRYGRDPPRGIRVVPFSSILGKENIKERKTELPLIPVPGKGNIHPLVHYETFAEKRQIFNDFKSTYELHMHPEVYVKQVKPNIDAINGYIEQEAVLLAKFRKEDVLTYKTEFDVPLYNLITQARDYLRAFEREKGIFEQTKHAMPNETIQKEQKARLDALLLIMSKEIQNLIPRQEGHDDDFTTW